MNVTERMKKTMLNNINSLLGMDCEPSMTKVQEIIGISNCAVNESSLKMLKEMEKANDAIFLDKYGVLLKDSVRFCIHDSYVKHVNVQASVSNAIESKFLEVGKKVFGNAFVGYNFD